MMIAVDTRNTLHSFLIRMMKPLLILPVLLVLVSGIGQIDAVIMQLKYQINGETDPDNYVCWNRTQILVERPNEKFACVSPHTMMKLDWQPYNYDSYYFDIVKGGLTYSVFAHDSSGAGNVVSKIQYHEDASSLLIDLPRTNSGQLFIEIPRMLLDAKFARCDETTDESPDDTFFTLVDGEEVEYKEVFTTDTYRTLDIPFKKSIKQIEVLAGCLI